LKSLGNYTFSLTNKALAGHLFAPQRIVFPCD